MIDILDKKRIKDRIAAWFELKESEGLTQTRMAVMVGKTKSYFNGMAKMNTSIGLTALEHIMTIDPKLNKYWLFFGEGNMYEETNSINEQKREYVQVSNKNIETDTEIRTLINELKMQIRKKDDQIKIKDDQIKFLQHLIEDKLQ